MCYKIKWKPSVRGGTKYVFDILENRMKDYRKLSYQFFIVVFVLRFALYVFFYLRKKTTNPRPRLGCVNNKKARKEKSKLDRNVRDFPLPGINNNADDFSHD